MVAAAVEFRPILLLMALDLTNGNMAAGEDLVGDCFLRFVEKPPAPQSSLQLKHWLRTVLRRRWIDARPASLEEAKLLSLDVLSR